MDLIIPGWAVALMGAFGSGLIAWLVWLTLGYYQNKQAIAVNTTNDENVVKKFDDIDQKINDMKSDFKEWCNKLESKFDQFIITENSVLKELLKK